MMVPTVSLRLQTREHNEDSSRSERLAHSNTAFRTLPVLLNNVLKRPEEVFLEAEVGQLSFL